MAHIQRSLKYKILFLASWYPNRTNNILGMFVKKKALAVLMKCDVAVLYVTADVSLTQKSYEIVSNMEDGIFTVRVYFKFFSSGFIRKIIYNISYMRAHYLGWKTIKNNWGKPDLIHVNVIDRAGYIALLLRYFKKIRYVITEHSTPDIDYLRGINSKTNVPLKYLKAWVIKKSEFLNVDSQASLDYLKKVGFKGNFGIIKNVVDIYPEYLNRGRKSKENKVKKAVHISILNERKNVSDIIRAFAHIINQMQRKNVELHLIGDGEQKEKLKYLAKEFGLYNKNIFFHGFVDEREKLEILTGADVHILNSDSEGFSVVTAEAILYGIPVIATKCGGPEDFVTTEVGILIERRNLSQLIDAIIYIFDYPEKYDPLILQEFGKKNFSPETICEDTYKVYESVLNVGGYY